MPDLGVTSSTDGNLDDFAELVETLFNRQFLGHSGP